MGFNQNVSVTQWHFAKQVNLFFYDDLVGKITNQKVMRCPESPTARGTELLSLVNIRACECPLSKQVAQATDQYTINQVVYTKQLNPSAVAKQGET